MLTTIVYSAFSTQLQISGEAIVRSDNDVRITNVKLLSQSNGAYETYNNKHTKDTTSMFVTLPGNSTITYEVEVTNKNINDYSMYSIDNIRIGSNISYIINKEYIFIDRTDVTKFEITIVNNTSQDFIDTIILKYNFAEANATFLSGPDFNYQIKQLSKSLDGDVIDGYYVDEKITSITRASLLPDNITLTNENIVSTSDSTIPIYAWYDNGTIYYYTEVDKPFINQNSSCMFKELRNLKTLNFQEIDTSELKSMFQMFWRCYSLESLDLSNFNTKNITSMNGLFGGCRSLKYLDISSFDTSNVTDMMNMFAFTFNLSEINLSNFDTSNVRDMKYMFNDSRSIINLDISSFDMSKVTDSTGMFTNLINLESIKTPKVYSSSLTITLPKTLYDENNNPYTTLDSTSPIQTWLKINE